MRFAEQIDNFHIVLIKPSKYDDDGYVIRWWRNFMPIWVGHCCTASPWRCLR